jgi:hypothetical protein
MSPFDAVDGAHEIDPPRPGSISFGGGELEMKRRNSLRLLAAMPFAPLKAHAQSVGKVG